MQTATQRLTHRGIESDLAWFLELVLASAIPESESTPSAVASIERRDIAAATGGDDEAFRRIVLRHQSTVATQMQRFSRDSAVVEELVHDVFVEAFVSLNGFRHRSPFEHWLRKIAVRVGYRLWKTQARDRQRRDAILSELSLRDLMETPCNSASDAHDRLHEILETMSNRDRLVLTLLYWDDCTVAEAAELAGWTKAMVKVQAHRARKKLKGLLEDTSIEDTNDET